jgi:hypothetical protein
MPNSKSPSDINNSSNKKQQQTPRQQQQPPQQRQQQQQQQTPPSAYRMWESSRPGRPSRRPTFTRPAEGTVLLITEPRGAGPECVRDAEETTREDASAEANTPSTLEVVVRCALGRGTLATWERHAGHGRGGGADTGPRSDVVVGVLIVGQTTHIHERKGVLTCDAKKWGGGSVVGGRGRSMYARNHQGPTHPPSLGHTSLPNTKPSSPPPPSLHMFTMRLFHSLGYWAVQVRPPAPPPPPLGP